jgi:HNH endonuclease
MHYQIHWRANTALPICSVEGCEKIAQIKQPALCAAHYRRLRRYGSTDLRRSGHGTIWLSSDGYVLEWAPNHPLAQKSGHRRIYQHRRVFYDTHGEGPFACFACRAALTWADKMDVAHLDNDKTNNAPDNLTAACPTCNRARSLPKMRQKMKDRGVQLTAFGKTMCITDWARHLSITSSALAQRLKRGWPLERALSQGRGHTGSLPRTVQCENQQS